MENEPSLMDQKETGFRVSVIIPVHNDGEFLGRAIDSVLKQSYPVEEIIVVDDGSTEDIQGMVQKYGQRVRYVYQDRKGPGGARNRGIEMARGDWIAFLDGDDEWCREKIEKQVDILNQHRDLMWCSGNYIRCFENHQRVIHLPVRLAMDMLKGRCCFDDYFRAYVHEAGGNSDTFLIHRKVFEEVGCFREDFCAEDTDLWWRIAIYHRRIGYVPDPVSVYYVHRINHAVEKTRDIKRLQMIDDLIQRNWALAEEKGQLYRFIPCVSYCLRRTIRGALFYSNLAPAIRGILTRRSRLFGLSYRLRIRLLTLFPRATAAACHAISRAVRFLNIHHYR